jgi:hypothetical protein
LSDEDCGARRQVLSTPRLAGNAPWPRALIQGNGDLEHTVLHFRGELLEVYLLRERYGAEKTSVTALDCLVSLLVAAFLALLPSLTQDSHAFLGRLDADILLANTRQIRPNDERIALLLNIDARRPECCGRPAVVGAE